MSPKPAKFVNRELSWLEFNQRVLDEATTNGTPLLERLKFLAITASNLDEFFRVRVGGLLGMVQNDISTPDPTGLTPTEQLDEVRKRVRQMVSDQYDCFSKHLEPALSKEDFQRITPDGVTNRQASTVRRMFESEIFPILSPMAVSLDREFPLLMNQALHLCVSLAPIDEEEPFRVAVIPLGPSTQRFLTLRSRGGYTYMLLEDAVELCVEQFFPGEEVLECATFRISRNADMAVREDVAADLLSGMSEVLEARKLSSCVRLELADTASEELEGFLREAFQVSAEDTYRCKGPVDLSDFMSLATLRGFDKLKYEAWPPLDAPSIDLSVSIFDTIAEGDVLLYHPYESFAPVVKLIEEAANDPDVLAIKQVLYRTSRKSPIVRALAKAASNGKHVTALIELKARFDEARNIEWSKNLEREGVQVVYGVRGLKTHAKICMIVRRESQGVVRYCHFGTGNYNESTAKLYSDISLMTCDEDLGNDATQFFNAVTGYSQPKTYRKLEAAPIGLRDRIIEMIEAETSIVKEGGKGIIQAKINSLVDPLIIEKLYEASQAGVEIKLNVRGICCLRPGVKGMSENIHVVSIIDRFLEHARVLYFHHGGDERMFISSADWMPRNLDRRVELLVPVEAPHAKEKLREILDVHFRDNMKARVIKADGSYTLPRRGRRKGTRSQELLYEMAQQEVSKAAQSKRTVFEPHRSE